MEHQHVRGKRPVGSDPNPVRSVRVPDEVWDVAKERADIEGVTMSYVLSVFIEGYATNAFDLPAIELDFSHSIRRMP